MKKVFVASALMYVAIIGAVLFGGKYFIPHLGETFGLAALAYVVYPILLIPLGFAFYGLQAGPKKALEFFGVSLLGTVIVAGMFYGYSAWYGYSTRDERAAQQQKYEEEAKAFENQGYPIRILDSTETTVLNQTTISIRSPYTFHVNVLESAIPPDGVITAQISQNSNAKGPLAIIKLRPTGKVLNGRHYYQGVASFTLGTDAEGVVLHYGALYVTGVSGQPYGMAQVFFE